MTLEFTPPVVQDRFALSVGTFFKTYATLGLAKMAYHYRAGGYYGTTSTARILEKVGDKWFVLYQVDTPRDTPRESLPWYKLTDGGYYYGRYTQGQYKPVPMSAEDYASWRLRVEYELLAKMDPDDVIERLDTLVF